MLNRLVDLARNAESEQVRLAAQDKILDRAYGKAPQHVDVTAMRHTEIDTAAPKRSGKSCSTAACPEFCSTTRSHPMTKKTTATKMKQCVPRLPGQSTASQRII